MGCAIARRLSFTTARVALVEAAERRRRGRIEGQHRHRHVRRRLPARLARGRARHAVEPGLGGALRLARHAVSAHRRPGGRPHRRGRGARSSELRAGARANRCEAEIVTGERGASARADARRRRPGPPSTCPATGSSIRSASRSATPSWPPETASRCTSTRRSPASACAASASPMSRRRAGRDRRRVRRERRRDRGRHGLAARRRRAVHDVAAAGPVLAARPRDRLEVPGDRGRRPDRREPRRLLRPDDARVAAPRADGARRDRPGDRAVGRGVARRVFAAARRLVPELDRRWAIKTFAANRPASEPGYRIGDRPKPREPGARRRHPLDRRVVVAGASPSSCTRSSPRPARPCRTSAPGAATALEPVPRLFGHRRPGGALRPRPRLRRGRLPVRAGDRGRDRRGASDARAAPLGRRRCASARTPPPAAARARCASAGSPGSEAHG